MIISRSSDFSWSSIKVLKVILLKPNFSSNTKLKYNEKGMDNTEDKRPIKPKKTKVCSISVSLIDEASADKYPKPPKYHKAKVPIKLRLLSSSEYLNLCCLYFRFLFLKSSEKYSLNTVGIGLSKYLAFKNSKVFSNTKPKIIRTINTITKLEYMFLFFANLQVFLVFYSSSIQPLIVFLLS